MLCSPKNFTQPPTSWGKYSVWDVQWMLNVPRISHIQACTSAHQGVFQGIGFPSSFPLISPSSHHLFSLFCHFPSLSSSSAVFSALWGVCSQADEECHWLLSQHITIFSCFPPLFFFFPSEQTPQHTHSHVSLYPPFPWIMSLKSESTGEAFSLLFLLRQDKLMETYQCTV